MPYFLSSQLWILLQFALNNSSQLKEKAYIIYGLRYSVVEKNLDIYALNIFFTQ